MFMCTLWERWHVDDSGEVDGPRFVKVTLVACSALGDSDLYLL